MADHAAGDVAAATPSPTAAPLPAALAHELRRYLELGYMEGFVTRLEEALQADPGLADAIAPLRESARRFMLDDLERQLSAVTGAAHHAA